jgi:hypothetical protein
MDDEAVIAAKVDARSLYARPFAMHALLDEVEVGRVAAELHRPGWLVGSHAACPFGSQPVGQSDANSQQGTLQQLTTHVRMHVRLGWGALPLTACAHAWPAPQSFFGQSGKVVCVRFRRHIKSKAFKGSVFVEFETEEEADKARRPRSRLLARGFCSLQSWGSGQLLSLAREPLAASQTSGLCAAALARQVLAKSKEGDGLVFHGAPLRLQKKLAYTEGKKAARKARAEAGHKDVRGAGRTGVGR